MKKEGTIEHITLADVIKDMLGRKEIKQKYPHGINSHEMFAEIWDDGYDMTHCTLLDVRDELMKLFKSHIEH